MTLRSRDNYDRKGPERERKQLAAMKQGVKGWRIYGGPSPELIARKWKEKGERTERKWIEGRVPARYFPEISGGF